jgi:hypothetical protein
MGLSKKDIYNNALQKVSRQRVSTVDDGSYEANLCNELFTRVLDHALFEHNWSSCTFRAKLVETVDIPVIGYIHSYQLPNDCIRIIQAYYSTEKWSFDFEWELQNRELLTDQPEVYIKYIQRPSNFEQLNPQLTEVLVWRLALELAMPMQLDRQDEQFMRNTYEANILPRAKALDSMESRYLEYEENPWVESLNNNFPQNY